MAATTLIGLPDEILASIFRYLDVPTVIALNKTSKRFVDLAGEPLLWRELCQASFKYWDDRKKFRTSLLNAQSYDWKMLYASRCKNSHFIDVTVRDIINDPVARIDKIQAILVRGYKSKDALLRLFNQASLSSDHLAQKYWSHIALGSLHRGIALEEWKRIRSRSQIENRTERALAALDMFILDEHEEGDIDDVFDRLESYVDAIRQAYPNIDEESPRQKATVIADYLRERGWISIHNQNRSYRLDNMFLGVSLHSKLRDSLPLISAVIYCYVCRQFNLRAQPCNFPMHVHALVQPPLGLDLDNNTLPESDSPSESDQAPHNEEPQEHTHLYMDPFRTSQSTSLTFLRRQIRFIVPSATQAFIHASLTPATYNDLVHRSAKNIIDALTRPPSSPLDHPIPPDSAFYAAYFALVMFPSHPALLRTNLSLLAQQFLNAFDHDINLFRSHVLPMTSTLPDALAYQKLLAQLLESQSERPEPKRRSDQIPVRYRVGQIFRHRRQGYLAAIYGWDPTCEMSSHWISINNVDRLPNGREQPFYNAFVADDGTSRYVAEENIVLVGKEEEGGNGEMISRGSVEGFGIEIGKWFKRFDWGVGRFVSNVRDEYPED